MQSKKVKNKIVSVATALLSPMASAWRWMKCILSVGVLAMMATVGVMAKDDTSSPMTQQSQPSAVATSPEANEVSTLAPEHSLRPKARPSRGNVSAQAPKTSLRPKARPDSLMRSWAIQKALAEAMKD